MSCGLAAHCTIRGRSIPTPFSTLHAQPTACVPRLRRPGATYIDFGSWIGPTVLFSTPYAGKVYALEPDPLAYKQVYWNVKANPHIAAKVTVQNLCISNSSGKISMWGVQGDSMSTLSSVQAS